MKHVVILIAVLIALYAQASMPEKTLLANYNNVSRPDSITLEIINATGSRVMLFRNSELTADSEQFYMYELIDYLPGQHIWVIQVNGFEWIEWQLVNENTGVTTTTISPPMPSPDGTRLFCHMEDIDAGFIDNGIQIWKLQADSLFLEFSDLDVPWGPINGEWLDNETIVFEKLVYDYDDYEYKTTPGTIRLNENGDWEPAVPEDWKLESSRG